ncbi:hypothetical protein E2C01_020994 [Portunus trituberculatus]|uniref:Uncharacterized protein n=1 Tax=Portunus trituberculatus TaxID=210409 RepID=A0A5B7E1K6_PORTR|nr:hypothetical protein [Portunus trituberculatus]
MWAGIPQSPHHRLHHNLRPPTPKQLPLSPTIHANKGARDILQNFLTPSSESCLVTTICSARREMFPTGGIITLEPRTPNPAGHDNTSKDTSRSSLSLIALF